MMTNYHTAKRYVDRCEHQRKKRNEEKQTTLGLVICLVILLGIAAVIWRVNVLSDRADALRWHDSHPSVEVRP